MLMQLVEALRSLDVRPRATHPANSAPILEVEVDGHRALFSVHQRARAPYPGEIERVISGWPEADAAPLLLAPHVSDGVAQELSTRGWSWADEVGNFHLAAPGIRLRQRVPTKRSPIRRRGVLPGGTGSVAIIRQLIRSPKDALWSSTKLAASAGITQPRASQVLAKLKSLGLVEQTRRGWRAHNRSQLLDTFISDYPGPGGSEVGFYSLDEPLQEARRLHDIISKHDPVNVAISADVGPDLVASWRRPTLLIVYVSQAIDMDELHIVRSADSSDANVLVRIPRDLSVFRSTPLKVRIGGDALQLADETQMLWDLHDLGGDDRLEAAEHLRKRIFGGNRARPPAG